MNKIIIILFVCILCGACVSQQQLYNEAMQYVADKQAEIEPLRQKLVGQTVYFRPIEYREEEDRRVGYRHGNYQDVLVDLVLEHYHEKDYVPDLDLVFHNKIEKSASIWEQMCYPASPQTYTAENIINYIPAYICYSQMEFPKSYYANRQAAYRIPLMIIDVIVNPNKLSEKPQYCRSYSGEWKKCDEYDNNMKHHNKYVESSHTDMSAESDAVVILQANDLSDDNKILLFINKKEDLPNILVPADELDLIIKEAERKLQDDTKTLRSEIRDWTLKNRKTNPAKVFDLKTLRREIEKNPSRFYKQYEGKIIQIKNLSIREIGENNLRGSDWFADWYAEMDLLTDTNKYDVGNKVDLKCIFAGSRYLYSAPELYSSMGEVSVGGGGRSLYINLAECSVVKKYKGT